MVEAKVGSEEVMVKKGGRCWIAESKLSYAELSRPEQCARPIAERRAAKKLMWLNERRVQARSTHSEENVG